MANVIKQINWAALGGLCARDCNQAIKHLLGWRRALCSDTPWPRL